MSLVWLCPTSKRRHTSEAINQSSAELRIMTLTPISEISNVGTKKTRDGTEATNQYIYLCFVSLRHRPSYLRLILQF